MAILTRNFTAERPLSPRVISAISTALADGWADPKKLSQASHRSSQLRASSLEQIASYLAVSPASLEPIGEPDIGHLLSIGGLLRPEMKLITTSVAVGKARAVARNHQGPSLQLEVDSSGASIKLLEALSQPGLLSLQSCNGETGVRTDLELIERLRHDDLLIALDATNMTPTQRTFGFADTVLFDSTSWGGPQGLGLLAINNRPRYLYPLPHIAPIATPGSYSLPLLVGSAVAIEEFYSKASKVVELRSHAIAQLESLSGAKAVAAEAISDSPHLSILIDGFSSEEVMRALHQRGFEVDAGSACSPEDLAPSHVIAAMGLPTTGHLRITLHDELSIGDVEELAEALKVSISTS